MSPTGLWLRKLLSAGSDDLFQRSKGKARVYINLFFCFEKGDEHVVKHKKITANPKQQASQVNDFGVSLYMLLFSHQDLSDFFATP